MKDFQLKKYHNAKHIYLEIESNKKLIPKLKCIIQHHMDNKKSEINASIKKLEFRSVYLNSPSNMKQVSSIKLPFNYP